MRFAALQRRVDASLAAAAGGRELKITGTGPALSRSVSIAGFNCGDPQAALGIPERHKKLPTVPVMHLGLYLAVPNSILSACLM
jgi:hypothetical protein